MNLLKVLTSNYIINVGFVSFFSAQILKTIFTFIATKKIDPERMIGAGGMPSSHSALTSSVAIAMARKLGFASPEFALALAFAAIVMYDAMGVRRAAGEQAKVLNRLVVNMPFFSFNIKPTDLQNPSDGTQPLDDNADLSLTEVESNDVKQPLMDKELKEFLGHTPIEVLGGCLLGILIAIFIPK